jgi:hypothetical protein
MELAVGSKVAYSQFHCEKYTQFKRFLKLWRVVGVVLTMLWVLRVEYILFLR